MKLEERYVCKIDIPDGFVDVTDPCYGRDEWCRMTNIDVKSGKYNCFSLVGEMYLWRRPYRCRIQHEDFAASSITDDRWRHIGRVGVDSGLC